MGAYRVDTNHPWPDNTVLGGFFLVLTNLVLIPPIFIMLRIGHWGTAGVLTALMLVSSSYHACRAGFVCLMRFRDSQTLDHLLVFCALLWVSANCIVKREFFSEQQLALKPEIRLEAVVMVFFLLCTAVFGLILNDPESHWTMLFGFGLPVSLVVLASAFSGARVFYHSYYGYIGLALFGVAVVPYMFMPAEWYDVSHSVWHVLSMLSIPFISVACDYRWQSFRLREQAVKKQPRPPGNKSESARVFSP